MAWTCTYLIVFLIFLISANPVLGTLKYAILAAESPSEKENLCLSYISEFSEVPSQKSQADFHILKYELDGDFCVTEPTQYYDQQIVLITPNNCSIASQAHAFEKRGAVSVLFVIAGSELNKYEAINQTDGVKIIVGLISDNSMKRLTSMAGATGCIYAPDDSGFDYSLLIIWIIAMLALSIGAYWSGLIRYSLYLSENQLTSLEVNQDSTDGSETPCQNQPTDTTERSTLSVTPLLVTVFVLCMCGTLLLMYFFFQYLVYFLIALFFFVSINSVYVCIYPVVMKICPMTCKLFRFHYKKKLLTVDFRHIFLMTVALSLPLTWIITRNESYSWIFQDILGVFFCINMLRTIRLPNLKICTLLLILLFVYDIFFVFITPLLTARGKSVMEEVVVGRDSSEKLPMVVKVPHFNVCYQQFSMLGFGDILVPGLLVSYCHGFDLINGTRKKYFLLTIISYGLGLIFTYVGLILMSSAQPALLYLVPSILIPVFILSWVRKEISLIWNGLQKGENAVHEISSDGNNQMAINGNENESSLPSTGGAPISSAGSAGDSNEQKQLINQ